MFPETSGRTLEELAFSKFLDLIDIQSNLVPLVFEGKEVRKRQVKETEQELHHEHIGAPAYPVPNTSGDEKGKTEHAERK